MTIIGLDPGNEKSAVVVWNGEFIVDKFYADNEEVLYGLTKQDRSRLVIEQIASYGMAVGAEVFETVFWSGRFAQAYGMHRVSRIKRLEIKMHLCHDSRAKDGNIRQALIDRLGAPGTKNNQGATYGISGDLWAALAVAVTYHDKYSAQDAAHRGSK